MDSILEDPQQHHWTAPGRADLPTPSYIMNGVAYSTFLLSAPMTINPSTMAENIMGSHCTRTANSPVNLSPVSAQHHCPLPPANTKVMLFLRHLPRSFRLPNLSVRRKPRAPRSLRIRQIPSSINDSKGSLTEFAVQVRFNPPAFGWRIAKLEY